MDFEERIREIIADGLQHVKDEKQLDEDFKRDWGKVRETVWSVLARAKKAAQGTVLGALKPDHENGCTVLNIYQNTRRGTDVAYGLRFCPDDKTRQVVCSVTPKDLISDDESRGFPESFTLDGLTETMVEEKVAAFFEAILRQMADKRQPRRASVY